MAASRSAAALAALLLLLRGAAAQQFSGIWELVNAVPGPTGVTSPQGTYFGLPATTAGMFVVASSDAGGANSTFAYDPTPNAWTEFPPPAGYTALQPVVVTLGGFIVTFSTGLLDDLSTVSVLDSSLGQLATWTAITLAASTPAFPYRNGGRVAVFGSILYRFGGSDMGGVHNDIWALDLSYVLTSGFSTGTSAVGWVLVAPDVAAANYPAARSAGILAVEGHTIILFGGSSASATYMNDVSGAAAARRGAARRGAARRGTARRGAARRGRGVCAGRCLRAAGNGVEKSGPGKTAARRMMLRTILILHQ